MPTPLIPKHTVVMNKSLKVPDFRELFELERLIQLKKKKDYLWTVLNAMIKTKNNRGHSEEGSEELTLKP